MFYFIERNQPYKESMIGAKKLQGGRKKSRGGKKTPRGEQTFFRASRHNIASLTKFGVRALPKTTPTVVDLILFKYIRPNKMYFFLNFVKSKQI